MHGTFTTNLVPHTLHRHGRPRGDFTDAKIYQRIIPFHVSQSPIPRGTYRPYYLQRMKRLHASQICRTLKPHTRSVYIITTQNITQPQNKT